MTPAALDFRKPPPGELERQAGGWLALACRRTAASWSKVLCYPAELRPGPVETMSAASAIGRLPDDTLGILVSTGDPGGGTLLLAVRRPLLLTLLAGLLGDTPTELPADRDPTDLEGGLVEYAVRELFLDPLERGWPGAEPLRLTAGTPASPRSAWRGPSSDMVLAATLTVSTPFGDHPVQLVLTRVGRWERLSQAAPVEREPDPANDKQIEALVREMRVELDVVLGTADLTMSDLGRLKAGDLVVLRQKVGDPLDGRVAGERKFRVWPGAVGTRAAVLIHTPAED